MKKTLLALAVVTAAGSANAGINLYDTKGVKVDLTGAAEVQYFNSYNPMEDAELRLDDGDLAANVSVAISDDLNAIAGIGFKFEDIGVENDDLWAGFSSNQFGTITFGRQVLISDDAGIGKDIELGSEGISFPQTAGDEVIKYTYDNGMFYAGISTDLRNSDEVVNPNGDGTVSIIRDNDTRIIDGRVGFRANGLDARVYYYDMSDKFLETSGYNLEAEYTLGNLGLAASFGQLETKEKLTGLGLKLQEADVYQIAASYSVDKTTFAAGYNRTDVNNAGDVYSVYGNVTQQLHDNVNVYAEIGHTNQDIFADSQDNLIVRDAQFGYLAGLEVTF